MPQRPGNHGIVIPRDRTLLTRLYWDEGKTLPQIGAMFNVTHKSVERVFRNLSIPRREPGTRTVDKCIDCGGSVFKIPHPLTKAGYGRRCVECQVQHKTKLRLAYDAPVAVRARQKEYMKEYHKRHYVPKPLGEKQWIAKSRAMLRTVKRMLRGNLAAS